ncbi:hypothetical protein DDB_G0270280 [Dictyostelium discoideum AX4]|uniref:Uncharacterized protein n=1 Tax=Dictyostelium discoideum TaxID=44689 RepID=Q55C07_DICDI|nr:hypothetical protein DDB_G0270280 [Dictyostelium discoideum AX4]EAL72490.1 hypothetical protein DDB_G0270280 [Dictyostelium discoideum AX4]|eukprot:XP_646674.1 hypothetical protein DDB_G0270280 [Dictyostelium discoideum AX4]
MTLVASLTKLGNPTASLSSHSSPKVETHAGVSGEQMGNKSEWMGRSWQWGPSRQWYWQPWYYRSYRSGNWYY